MSNKEYKTLLYRKLDRVLLMKSRSVILKLLDKESVEKEDVIFIKDGEKTSTPVLTKETKRQRRLLNTDREVDKKKSKITTLSSSKEKKKDKNKNSSDFKDKNRARLEKIAPKAKCYVYKLEIKLNK